MALAGSKLQMLNKHITFFRQQMVSQRREKQINAFII